MTTLTAIGIIFLCVLGEAFFSGSEIALVSVDRMRMKHAAKMGNRPSRLVLNALKNPERILGTTLLGTNLCTITSTTVAASQFYLWLGPAGVPVSILVMTFINLIFAEIVPKSIFQQKSNEITLRVIYILRVFLLFFFPLVWVFSKIAILLTKLFGASGDGGESGFISKEELKLLTKMKHDRGDVKQSERKMINRLLDFTETSVKEVMIPLIEVAALSDCSTVREATDKFVHTKHRRIPIFRERVDKIIGILNSFDILEEDSNKKIKSLVRPAYYVPATMSIAQLLEGLQSGGRSMAIVVDEFGGAEGIVTVEDILEEVVGEIEDEYDDTEYLFKIQSDKSLVVSGRMPVDELNDRFKLTIPEGDYETIGGFFLEHTKRIPNVGEKITLNNIDLVITKANNRIIREITIRMRPDGAAAS